MIAIVNGRAIAALAAMVLGFAVAACAGDRPEQTGVRDWSSLEITLERGVCFGTCPDYTVTIHGDGRVVFEGRRFVAKMGRHEGRIDPSDVRSLLAKFRRADFFTLRAEYHAQVTDLPTYRVTLAYDGRRKTVSDYGGAMSGMPAVVTELENAIDETANTQQWVKG
jgi:hypothetical protein